VTRVVVVGGGFGGLLAATELQRRGVDVLVLEAGHLPGGVARTIREDGYLLEPAAGTLLLPHPHLSPILDHAGIVIGPDPGQQPDTSRPSVLATGRRGATRYVFDHGKLFEVKPSPALITSGLVSTRGKLRAAFEPFVRAHPPCGTDEALGPLLRRRLGVEMGELVATLMAHGVYAADPEMLSARSAFPALVALEDHAGSVVKGGIGRMRERRRSPRTEHTQRPAAHVPVGGMAALADALAGSLGECWRPGTPVESLRRNGGGWMVRADGIEESEARADAVVVALSPSDASALVPTEVAELLERGRPRHLPVALVGIGGRAADVPIPTGFGVLTGPGSGLRALGLLFESNFGDGRAPAHHRMVRGIFGGAADPDAYALTDAELTEVMIRETGEVIGTPVLPQWCRVVRQPLGIPQYELGHGAWLNALDLALGKFPGLHLGGWSYRGIGLSALAADAARLADQVSAR